MYEKTLINYIDSLRNSGINLIGNVSWGTHFCEFYKTKEDLLDILIPYFKTGLENNEFCMWITSDPLNIDEVLSAMKKNVSNFDEFLKNHQIEILPYHQWYLINGMFNPNKVLEGWVTKLNQALERGFDGLRLSGNTFWLERLHWRDFAEYEITINSIINQYNIIALCTYSLDKCGINEILDVMNSHQFALIKQEKDWKLIESVAFKQTRQALEIEIKKQRVNEKKLLKLNEKLRRRVKSLKILHNRLKYQSLLVDNIPDAVYSMDQNLNILSWNKGAENLFGWTEPEVLFKNRDDILHPQYNYTQNQIKSKLNKNGTWQGEGIFKKKNGSDINTLITNALFHDQTKPDDIYIEIVKDISEIKKVQQNIIDIAKFPDENPNPVLRVDEHQILYINLVGKKVFNLEKGDPLPETIRDIVKETYHDRINYYTDIDIKGNTYSLGFIPIKDANYINIYATEITSKKQAETRLKNFVSTVSHEIRTPLTVLSQSAYLLNHYYEKISNEQKKDLTNNLYQNSKILMDLVEDLLYLVQFDNKKITLDINEFNLYESLQISIDIIKKKYLSKNIAIENNIVQNLLIKGDSKRIEEIFRILLDNSFKYSESGTSILISIEQNYIGKLNPHQIPGHLIRIKDCGRGIPKEDLPFIFNRFFRANNVKDLPGTGLGLSIAKELLNLLNGDIFLESEVNQGTTYYLFLPL